MLAERDVEEGGRRMRVSIRAMAVMGILAIAAAACGGANTPSSGASATPSARPRQGGSIVADNTRRTTTQELLQNKVTAAGFAFKIKNYEAGILFGDVGPKGKFTVADYATGGSVDPSITSTLACENIPTSQNQFAGGNWNHWCDQQATNLMHQSDRELDQNKRLNLLTQVYDAEATDFVSLPLYVLPNVGAWRTDKIAGPVSAYIPSNLGMFWNMN
jgi:peptide/nickel transport system substrate-binding protein